jgi:Gpi18-like mannosyltransferase
MNISDKPVLKISALIVLLISGLLCVYTVWNYKGNTSVSQNRSGFNNTFKDNRTQPPVGDGHKSNRPNMPNASMGSNRPMEAGHKQMGGASAGSGLKYNTQIIVYSTAFFILFAAGCFAISHKKMRINPENAVILIWTFIGVGLFLRIAIAALIEGHPSDLNLFKNWASTASNNLLQVYSGSRSADYPPLYMYVLFLIGKIASITAINPYYTLLLKLPSIAADIITSILIYKLARKKLSLELSMLLAAFYIFNPAVLINSTIWGQVDSLFTLIIIAAVFMLTEKKIGISSALFAAAVMMKPQGIIFLPVLFFELVRLKKVKNFLKAAAIALCTALIIILPFSINMGFTWIFKLYSGTVGEYPYASVNAFNFFSLIGKNYVKDSAAFLGLSYHNWGMLFIVLITLFCWFIYIKGNSRKFAFAAALMLIAGVFTFSASMHERYLFPALALAILAFIYIRDKRLLMLSAGFSCTIFLNTYYVLYETLNGINAAPYTPTLIFTSLLNVVLFIYLIKILSDIAIRKKCIIKEE